MGLERNYPDWITGYCEYAQHTEAPEKFHLWSGISTIAAVLGRRCWMDMGYFEWIPNFYIVFVGPPGVVKKSSAMAMGEKLLRGVPGVRFGPSSASWQALLDEFASAQTVHSMPNGTKLPAASLHISVSELGTFLNPQDREFVDFMVDMWDGKRQPWARTTRMDGRKEIINPSVNLIACTTPHWIAGNFPDYMIGGGFTSRTIFLYADKPGKLIAYPGDHLPRDFQARGAKLIEDLLEISQMAGEFYLSRPAKQLGMEWYDRHNASKPPHLANAQFEGYLARKQTHIHKLAMIYSASRASTLEITDGDLQRAIETIHAIELEMPKVFSLIGLSETAKDTQEVVEAIRVHGPISQQNLFRLLLNRMGVKEFQDALQGALLAEAITIHSGKYRICN